MARRTDRPREFSGANQVGAFGNYVGAMVKNRVGKNGVTHVVLAQPDCITPQKGTERTMIFTANVVHGDGTQLPVATLSYLCGKGAASGGGSCPDKRRYHCACLDGVKEEVGNADPLLRISRIDPAEGGHYYEIR